MRGNGRGWKIVLISDGVESQRVIELSWIVEVKR